MDIRVEGCRPPFDATLADHARRSVSLRLRRWQAQVGRVDVRLGGSAEGHGRNDTYCLIRLQMTGADATTIVDIADDSFTAIARAAGRAARMAEEQALAAGRAPAPALAQAAT
jgi:hypothetical protein